MQNNCVVCGNTLTLTIVYISQSECGAVPQMWKEVEPWYPRAENELPSKLTCKQCGLLYDHEA